MGSAGTLEIKSFRSIHEIDSREWDSILDSGDTFHSSSFIRVVEDAKVEAAQFWYLQFYDGSKLAATAALSAFTISLDLFLGDSGLVQRLKRFFPRIFEIRILICGLPASFGQSNLKVVSEKHYPEVCRGLSAFMQDQAKKEGIRFLSVKEFFEDEIDSSKHLEKNGFFLANSIPYMAMEIQWENFDDYLSSLRHPYRRRIRQSLEKIQSKRPLLHDSLPQTVTSLHPVWILREMTELCPKVFFESYLCVMSRTDTKLETLNEAFFTLLFREQLPVRILSLEHQQKVLSSAILVEQGEKLTFMLLGRTDEKDACDSYFNLVYGILSYAMEKGFKRIGLGQTAYWLKQSVGGVAKNEYLYFAATRPVVHRILKSCSRLIFPETKLPQVNVFKKESV